MLTFSLKGFFGGEIVCLEASSFCGRTVLFSRRIAYLSRVCGVDFLCRECVKKAFPCLGSLRRSCNFVW